MLLDGEQDRPASRFLLGHWGGKKKQLVLLLGTSKLWSDLAELFNHYLKLTLIGTSAKVNILGIVVRCDVCVSASWLLQKSVLAMRCLHCLSVLPHITKVCP